MRSSTDPAERDLLALAFSSEEEAGHVYAGFSHDLRDDYPDSACMFADMASEENEHRRRPTTASCPTAARRCCTG